MLQTVAGQATQKKGQPAVEQTCTTKQSKAKTQQPTTLLMQDWKAATSHANTHFTSGASLLPVSEWHLGSSFIKRSVHGPELPVTSPSALRKVGN